MTDHKKGDWIRVDAQVEDVLPESKAVTVWIPLSGQSDSGVKKRFKSMRGHSWVIESEGIHEVPIVPEADLLEEVTLRQEWMGGVVHEGTMTRICALRDAREAAAKKDIPDDGRELHIIIKLDADVITENVIKLTPKILRQLELG